MSASLALHGPPGEVPAGRPVPVRASLRNDGPGELWIVGVVDGSESGTRYPHWLPSIARDERTVAGPPRAEDAPVGPLRREDFHRLGEGEEFEPGRLATFATYAPPEAGAYVYSLVLSTESERVEDWFGSFNQDPAVGELVARVPRLTLRAELTVAVGTRSGA